ncbi:hypothetical protein ACIBFB_17700 [Nocardiopsis sp. NPDC050513]|uniref:hypothetical protein n=1 Tax=Nocardiopsis sp. NPDC050513 TaxID=3364338 RepID=UPI0037956268
MKRVLAIAAAAATLTIGSVAPASAAPGTLWWTFGDAWFRHDNPAEGCYTISEGDPAVEFQNHTAELVYVYLLPRCDGPYEPVAPDGRTDFSTRSYLVLD